MTTIHLGDCMNGCQTCSDNYHEGQEVCATCGRRVDEAISWGELAQLTHETQVAQFNFCGCEDMNAGQDAPYSDCPVML